MVEAIKFDFEPSAQALYEAFLLAKPEVVVEGLFQNGSDFLIVAPAATDQTEEGRRLIAWFERSFKPMTYPIALVPSRPIDAVAMPIRNQIDVARGFGRVRTWHDIDRDLALALPNDFPLHAVSNGGRIAIIEVERELDETELRILEAVYASGGNVIPYKVQVVQTGVRERPQNKARKRGEHSLEVLCAKHIPSTYPSTVKRLVEEDEDCWRTDGLRHLAGQELTHEPVPSGWIPSGSCLLDTTFPQSNIRSYLTLYPSVLIVAPLADSLDDRLKSFEITRKEFVELTRMGLVKWLLPQSIDRYDPDWLAEIAEAAPESFVLTRRLSLAAAKDQAKRNPLYGFKSDAYERRGTIRALQRFAEHLENKFVLPGFSWLSSSRQAGHATRALAAALAEYWQVAEYAMQVRGAMSSISGPLARHATELVKAMQGRDLFIEFGAMAQRVEWAGAFGTHLVPVDAEGYSEVGHARLLVGLSSGTSKNRIQVRRPQELTLAEELLTFDSDTDVLDFVRDLGDGDLTRARKILSGLSKLDETTAREAIDLWNSQIRSYERRADRLTGFNIAGILLAAASQASPNETVRNAVPILALLTPGLMTYLRQELASDSRVAGSLSDWANSALAGTAPDVVLVSRMRKKIAGMSKR
jgi:hypothetical protein